MNTLESLRIRIDPISPEDRQQIRGELANLLKNLHFASSKRYPAFLQYVVEKTLQGKTDELKERILGIEVFHRPSDYDTNSDTIVRVTAGEVRKRLALTYHESGEDHAIQILLPSGSYVPEFYRQTSAHDLSRTTVLGKPLHSDPHPAFEEAGRAEPAALALEPEDRRIEPAVLSPHERRWQRPVASALLFLLGIAAALLFSSLRTVTTKTSVDRFWQPVLASRTPVIFCAGALVPTVSTSAGFTEAGRSDDYPYISMATANALASVVDQFVRNRTDYVLQPASSTTLTDLRQHPTILVGAYNNKWTVMMLNDLRFRFVAKPGTEIYDSRNPGKIWSRPASLPYKDAEDYAIVARFHDRQTDNMVVVMAGVGKNGTEAAAQFVTTPRFLDLLDRQQIPNWTSKNIEIVLKTSVVDSKTGAPSIEAVEVW